jgi:protein-ribulosamine 3-kinase
MGKLCDGTYDALIENSVSARLGRKFSIQSVTPNKNGAMHDAALFSGDGFRAFVKLGTNPFSPDQFRQEAWGLRYIAGHSPVKTPGVVDALEAGGAALLILEAVDCRPVETKKDWETLGRGLAALHRTTWDRCGLETHSYLGIFRQDNRPMGSWPEFYGERRLRDTMKMAVDAGNLTPEQCRPVERLIARLPEVCGPAQPFSLLHGDPWPGNLLYDGKEMIAIDCSIYYGNREIDLSTVDFFFPVPEHFFGAYREAYPIEPGYAERKALWQINQWLGHVTLFGEAYLPKLMGAVERYL